MIGVFSLLLVQAITVGGFDKAPPVAIARGGGDLRANVARAAESCGVSDTWKYDDALWAHPHDMTAKKRACLARASKRPKAQAQLDRARQLINRHQL